MDNVICKTVGVLAEVVMRVAVGLLVVVAGITAATVPLQITKVYARQWVVGARGIWLRVFGKETRRTQLWLRLGVKAGDVFSYPSLEDLKVWLRLGCKAARSRYTQSERSTLVAANIWSWISTSSVSARTCVNQRASRLS